MLLTDIAIMMRTHLLIASLLFILLPTLTSQQDPYLVLGLVRGASRQDIKKAFKQLSLRFHPDINPSSKPKYQQIIQAYESLKNENRVDNDEQIHPNSQPSFVKLQDFMNEVEWEMRKQSSKQQQIQDDLNISFISWCFSNPKIIFAALSISLGIVFISK